MASEFDKPAERFGDIHQTPDLPSGLPQPERQSPSREQSPVRRTTPELAKAAGVPKPGVETPAPEPGFYL